MIFPQAYHSIRYKIRICHKDKLMSRRTLEFNMKRYINFKVLLTWLERRQNRLSPTRWIWGHFPPGFSRWQYKVGLSSHEDKFVSECCLNKIQHDNTNLKVFLTDMGIWCQSNLRGAMRVPKKYLLIIIWRWETARYNSPHLLTYWSVIRLKMVSW